MEETLTDSQINNLDTEVYFGEEDIQGRHTQHSSRECLTRPPNPHFMQYSADTAPLVTISEVSSVTLLAASSSVQIPEKHHRSTGGPPLSTSPKITPYYTAFTASPNPYRVTRTVSPKSVKSGDVFPTKVTAARLKDLVRASRSVQFLMETEKWTPPSNPDVDRKIKEWQEEVSKTRKVFTLWPQQECNFLMKTAIKIKEYLEKQIPNTEEEIHQLVTEYPECTLLNLRNNNSTEETITLFHLAAFYGKTNLVSLILEKTIHQSPIDLPCHTWGTTPLQFAVQSGHVEIINILLQKGADPNFCTKTGYSVLYFVVKSLGKEIQSHGKPWMISEEILRNKISIFGNLLEGGLKPCDQQVRKGIKPEEEWMVPLVVEVVNVNNYKRRPDGKLVFPDMEKWIEKFRFCAFRTRIPHGSLFSIFTGLHQIK